MAPLLARRPPADRAFERLYQRHVKDVYRYVYAVLRNADDAEDVTQTTFMNAYRAFQRGERPEQPKNWLIAIAHNVCRQRFRQQQRRPAEMPLFEDSAELAVEEPEESFTAEDIQRALGHLAFNQRAALVMRELEGRSYAEIAEIMGMTVGAVETLIFRGRRALREQLEGALTCAQAELALSKQADGVLDRTERGQLRAHLRECKECGALARRQRATRGALKALGAIPLPSSLASFFGGGGTAVTAGVAAKAAAVVCAGAVVGTAGFEGAKHVRVVHARAVAAKPVPTAPARQRPLAAAGRTAPSAPSLETLTRTPLEQPRPVPHRPPARLHGAASAHAAARAHAAAAPARGAGVPGRAAGRGHAAAVVLPEAENPVRPTPEDENAVRAAAPERENPASHHEAAPKPEDADVVPEHPARPEPTPKPKPEPEESKAPTEPKEPKARESKAPKPEPAPAVTVPVPAPAPVEPPAAPQGHGNGGGAGDDKQPK